MSTIDRLKRLTGEGLKSRPGTDANKPNLEELRRKIDAIMARGTRIQPRPQTRPLKASIPIETALSGEVVKNDYGEFFFSRNRFRADSRHGGKLIRECLKIDMHAASMLARHSAIAGCSPHDALFFDTETTGLAGGTGTLPFLIGLGFFEGNDFITCQLFARDFSDEKAMLAFLNETAAEKKFLVSFNGRAFDMNLLSARFILNRLEDSMKAMPHLDLLNPSRRLYSHRTSNCRLVTLEDEVLGFRRISDVPGSEIPQRYFDWLKTRNPSLMEDVFEHNRLDIVSMATLLSHLTEVVSGGCIDKAHPGDILAAAKLHNDQGNHELMRHMVESIIGIDALSYAMEAKKMLSLIYKRSGQWHEAVRLWEDIVSSDSGDVFALAELAKFCEHKSHDIGRALAIVEQVLRYDLITEDERDSFEHRRKRLVSKNAGSDRDVL
jgi:uncharacterized protein YprB with RNaseH-like and TPR domain